MRAEGIRFDESLEVLEDWDFLMRCALSFGAVATGRVTGTYHRWETGEASLDEHGQEVWATTRQALHESMEERLGTPGMIRRLASLYALPAPDRDEIEALRAELRRGGE